MEQAGGGQGDGGAGLKAFMAKTLELLKVIWVCRIWGMHTWTCAAEQGKPPTPEQVAGGIKGFWDYARMYCARCGRESEVSKRMEGRR